MLANLISRILLILTMMVGTVVQLVAVDIQPSVEVQESITKNVRPPIIININLVRPARDGLRANISRYYIPIPLGCLGGVGILGEGCLKKMLGF